MNKKTTLHQLRKNYTLDGISLSKMPHEPFSQFSLWLSQALEAGLPEPNAMVLSTLSSEERVRSRTVLLKEFDFQGFVFYTNYNSHKANDIQHHKNASLLFLWLELERQVRIEGYCEKIPETDSDIYFASRPRDSQLGAWASDQSSEVNSRQHLIDRYAALQKRYEGKTILRPPHWGGIRLVPDRIEFWQGRPGRLHDRIIFQRMENNPEWQKSRLQP